MKLLIQALAIAGIALFTSCKDSSSTKTDQTDTTIADVNMPANRTDNTYMGRTVEVPPATKTSFEAKYPQAANARWEYYRPDLAYVDWEWNGWPTVDTSDYAVNFNWNNTDYWGWYDQDGNWIGTTARISDYNSLPEPVNSTIKKQYDGYTISSVNKENDKNRTAYEIKLDKGTERVKLLIDENGKLLKKKVVGDSDSKEKMNPKDSAM